MNRSKITLQNVLSNIDWSQSYTFYALVAFVEKATDRTGRLYLNLKLVAQDAAAYAKKWNATEIDVDVLKQGSLVCVSGKWKEYRNLPQLNIDTCNVVNDKELATDLLPQPPMDHKLLKADLLSFFSEITDVDYLKIMKTIFDEKTLESFCEVRAGLRIHHNVKGGLLWHTVSILKAAKALLPIYSYLPINKSLLYAGIILHDFGKIEEIGNYFEPKYSLKGKLLGHITIASNKINEIGKKLGIDDKKIALLQHLTLASHGKLENGSPREPMLSEALFLSMLDNLDAKMGMLFNNFKNVHLGQFTTSFVLNSDHSLRYVEFWNHFSSKSTKK